MVAALEASQYFLVPVKPDFLSTIGLPLLDRVVRELYGKNFSKRTPPLTPQIEPLGIVYTIVNDQLTMTHESMKEIHSESKRLGYPVFSAKISASTKFSWSSRHALPIFRLEPRSKYAAEVKQVVDEFVLRIEL
jgi:chromosome partitioning protein